jgi:fibronectin-binding autotransporter adhesin
MKAFYMMGRSGFVAIVSLATLCLVGQLPIAHASVAYVGDVSPTSGWDSTTIGYVGYLGLSYGGTASVTVSTGDTLLSKTCYIGNTAGSTSGTVTVNGAGAKWNSSSGNVYVGYAGTGRMDITSGGSASNSSLYVGNSGTGTVNITSGGTVTSSSGYIGQVAGSTGTVNVDGVLGAASSTWKITASAGLTVGGTGSGTLSITNGGNVFVSNKAYISDTLGSTGAVTVDGTAGAVRSTLSTRNLYIGYTSAGTGTLSITNGGLVNSSNGTSKYDNYIGKAADSSGTVTVDGAGSQWTNGAILYIGGGVGTAANGRLDITHGGTVTNSGDCQIGYTGTGTVTVDGTDTGGLPSTWTTSGRLYVGGYTSKGAGTLNIRNGGVVNANSNLTWVGCAGNIPGGGSVTGVINFGPGGGTLSTQSLIALSSDLTGTGKVVAKGIVTDMDLTFDNSHPLIQNGLTLGGITIDLDATANTSTHLGVSSGTLTIKDAKVVGDNSGYVGYSGTGVATVDGPGSAWNNSGTLYVGGNNIGASGYHVGNGTLNVTNGGVVKCSNLNMSQSAGSTGTVNVNSGGTLSVNTINGNTGSMTLNFDNGTLQSSTGLTNYWIQPASAVCNVYIKEGGAQIDTLGATETMTVPLQHSGTNPDGGMTKLGTGTLICTAANTYTGWTRVGAGTLSLTQTCLYDAGSVRVDPGTTHAVLNLNTSGGNDTIRFLFLGGVPQAAGAYYAANSGGYITGNGTLTVSSQPLLGDANADGTVDGTDLNTVLSNYNLATGMDWWHGDCNLDGSVDGTDLNNVLSNYNQVASVGAAVPEPSTLLLAAAGLAGLLAYSSRKRR